MCADSYSTAGVSSLDLGQAGDVGVEHVHLLHQAGQGGLSSLTHLLIDLLGLRTRRAGEEKERGGEERGGGRGEEERGGGRGEEERGERGGERRGGTGNRS